MSYISPDSTIKILRGVPFENNYEHTILFETQQRQYDYFNSKVKMVAGTAQDFRNYTYQRVSTNKIRIGAPIQNFIDCNYLMFSNTAFMNGKWFYAFITNAEYVNNNVTEITYEIDVMQTWMFDYELQECFVEREHSSSDNPGDNTVPENLEVGDYIYTEVAMTAFDEISDFTIVIAAPFQINTTGQVVTTPAPIPGCYNGIFAGLHFTYYDLSNSEDVRHLEIVVQNMGDTKKEQIVAIYMIPTEFIANRVPPDEADFDDNKKDISIPRKVGWLPDYDNNQPTRFGVKNKKLHTYPYNVLHVKSSDGNDADFKYEMFAQLAGVDLVMFKMCGSLSIPPEFILLPKDYAMNTGSLGEEYNFNYGMPLKNIPMCSWESDGFKAWMAQSATSLIGGGIALAALAGATALGIPTAGVAAFAKMSFAATAYSSVSGLTKAPITPTFAHGEQKNNIFTQLKHFGYTFLNAHIKPEYAAIIDDYFTKYGYATKRVKIPNLRTRPFWNYVETKNCNISQSYNNVEKGLNAEDTRKISDIYDHGITFWHQNEDPVTGDLYVDVGDYSKDNSPGLG